MTSRSIEDILYSDIGNRIRKMRILRGLTQLEFSKMIHLSRPSLTNIENGVHKVSLTSLYQICYVLEVSIYDILPETIRNKKSASGTNK